MNKILFILLLLGGVESIQANDNRPPTIEVHGVASFSARVFKKISRFNLKVEAESGTRYTNKNYSSIKVGSSYLLAKGLKLGAYISEHKGLRHQDDWIVKGGDWFWDDTTQRSETISELGISYRKRKNELSTFLYGSVFSYEFNSFNGQTIIKLNPFAQKFILSKSKPDWSFKISLPLYIPVNFKSNLLYKRGVYISNVKHVSQSFLLSLSLKYLVESWGESQNSIDREQGDYSVEDHSRELLLSAIFIL